MKIPGLFRPALIFLLLCPALYFSRELGLWSLGHARNAWLFAALGFVVFLLLDLYAARNARTSDDSSFFRKLASLLGNERDSASSRPAGGRETGRTFFLLFFAGLGAFVFFWVFRQRVFLPPPQGLGDSLLLARTVPVFAHVFEYLDSFDELLELYIHSRFYVFAENLLGFDIIRSYAFLSAAAGAIYTIAVIRFLKGRNSREAFLGACLFFLSPALQLYAGYVENYTLVSLFISILLMRGARFLENRTGLVSAQSSERAIRFFFISMGALAALAALHHLIAAFTAPALVYLTWSASRGDRRLFLKRALWAGIPALVLLGLVWLYFFRHPINPLSFLDSHAARPPLLPPRAWFTSAHFLNLLNQAALGAPLAFVFLFFFLGRRPGAREAPEKTATDAPGPTFPMNIARKFARTPPERFALLALLGFGFDAFFHNPQLGFPADWDLMTFFQFPLHLYAFYLLSRPETRSEPRLELSRLAAGLFLGLFLTGAWLFHNSRSDEKSRENIKRLNRANPALVRELKSDRLFQSIADPRRKKKYARIIIFLRDGEEIARANRTPQAAKLLEQTIRLREKTRAVFALPSGKFQAQLIELWKELTELNRKLTALSRR